MFLEFICGALFGTVGSCTFSIFWGNGKWGANGTENEDNCCDFMKAFLLKSIEKEHFREVLQSHFPGSFETWGLYCSSNPVRSQFTRAAVLGTLSGKSRRLLETWCLPHISSLPLAASSSDKVTWKFQKPHRRCTHISFVLRTRVLQK